MFDSHIHLDDDRFDSDRAAVIQRSIEQGIDAWIVPATTRARWPKVEQMAQQYQGVKVAYGLHPMFMDEHGPEDLQALADWLETHEAVAIGECGLDFFNGDDDREAQFELFRGQLYLARQLDLPVIIHARKALDLVLREIRSSGVESGVIHSFSGSLQQAQQLAELGFKLGIAATVSFDRAQKLREVVKAIDLNALLIETDAPDQPGATHRGQRNEPSFIRDHLAVLAELRNTDINELEQRLSSNCRDLFKLSA
jgi:TatD DNase family protein